MSDHADNSYLPGKLELGDGFPSASTLPTSVRSATTQIDATSSIAVVRETPQRRRQDQGIAIAIGNDASDNPLMAPPPNQRPAPPASPSSFPTLSSFRLQPRAGTAVATPSPSFGSSSSRGRKRNAQCMGTPPPASTISNLFRDSPIGTISSFQPRISYSTTNASSSSCASPQTSTGDGGGTEQWCLSPPSVGRNPSRFESAMRSLSIKSPRMTPTPPSDNSCILSTPLQMNTNNRTPIRAPGSSFSVYSPSPLSQSSKHRRGGSFSSIGSGGGGKICCASPSASSAMSSPRLAPLKLIHQDLDASTPKKLPPRHMGPPSMLLSIDTSRHSSSSFGKDDVDDDQDKMLLGSPTILAGASAGLKPSPKQPMYPETPPQPQVCLRSVFSPGSTPGSAAKTPSRGGSASRASNHRSPRTPLPRATLTPRHTPSSRRGMPSPIHNLGLLPSNFSLLSHRRKSNEMSSASLVARKRAPASPLDPSYKAEQPTFEYSEKKMPAVTTLSSTPDKRKKSYLPMQDWYCKSPPKNQTFDSRGFPSVPTSVGGDRSSNMSTEDGPSGSSCGTREVKPRSLLAPPKNDDVLRAMANEFAPSVDDDSLTDEDEPFLLCDPAVLAEERKSSSRSRQRPRLSYTSLDPSSCVRPSSTSLASSGANASNTSLLGMNFLGGKGDSVASLSQRDLTSPSGSHKSVKRERVQVQPSDTASTDGAVGEGGGGDGQQRRTSSINGALSRLRSLESFGSIGLPLEAPAENIAPPDATGDATRDLSTPPPSMAQRPASPPPLSSDKDAFLDRTPFASICIARSDPASVNFAISKMAFQTFHNRSPGMECSS